MQKKLLLVLVLFFMTSAVCLSAPNYDPNKKPIVYDVTSDIALRKNLEDTYHKKYVICNKEKTICSDNAPLNAYQKEVVYPFARQKKYIDYDSLMKQYENQNN